MSKLKILLQSKIFIILSLLFTFVYVFIFTKVIKYNSKYDLNTSIIDGIVLNYNIDGDKLSLLIKGKEQIQVTYYINSEEEKNDLESKLLLGGHVTVSGVLSVPSNNTIPNTFNYRNYLYNKKIYRLMTASNIEIKSAKVSWLYNIKNNIVKKVNTYNASNYMYAFILGDNSYIDNDIYQTYRNNGVTHLFAVSGMHVSLLVLFILYIFNKLKFKEKYINILICAFLFFYMFLVGFSASVVRAGLLYIFLLANKKSGLNLNTLTVLYIIFILLVIINPFNIYDLGFIYSFLTSFGLILFNKKINGCYVKKLLQVSFIAFIFSLPVTLYNFYEFNLLTILNNILIVPLVSLILFPLTLITFIIPFLEPILILGFKILEFFNMILNQASLNIVIAKVNIIFVFSYYLGIYLIYKYGYKWVFWLILMILFFKFLPILDSNSYVYYLDVGQGDASLIVSANRRDVIMIDTGGKITFSKENWQIRNKEFNLADNIVIFLKSLGISKIDLLAITHGDMDHLGYAQDIIDKVRVSKIMLNNNAYNISEENIKKMIPTLIKDKYITKSLSLFNLNDLVSADENDSSLVLVIKMETKELLFMGDAPKSVEKEIMKKYNITPYILKLGHHGSKTSSDYDFLERLNPRLAIISAGRNNRYNHPSPETIENLKKLGLEYYSTQDKGTIEVKFKKGYEKIYFCVP